MKLKFLTLLIFAGLAQAECVLQSNTASQGTARIEERSGFTQELVRLPSNKQRCQVAFRARANGEWHTAIGHYDFGEDQTASQACAMARQTAESGLAERLTNKNIVSDAVVTCRDQSNLLTLRETRIGTVGLLHQFRPHPSYPNQFVHNNVACRWFLDSEFKVNDVYTYQGVICRLQDNKWVVVDKF